MHRVLFSYTGSPTTKMCPLGCRALCRTGLCERFRRPRSGRSLGGGVVRMPVQRFARSRAVVRIWHWVIRTPHLPNAWDVRTPVLRPPLVRTPRVPIALCCTPNVRIVRSSALRTRRLRASALRTRRLRASALRTFASPSGCSHAPATRADIRSPLCCTARARSPDDRTPQDRTPDLCRFRLCALRSWAARRSGLRTFFDLALFAVRTFPARANVL